MVHSQAASRPQRVHVPGLMTIKMLEQASGLPRSTIRVYEKRGLITPHEDPRGNGYRRYDETHLERLRTIRIAQLLGFSLREILSLARLEDAGRLSAKESHAIVVQKIRQIDERLAEIRQLRAYLADVEAWLAGGSVGPKPLFDSDPAAGSRRSRLKR